MKVMAIKSFTNLCYRLYIFIIQLCVILHEWKVKHVHFYSPAVFFSVLSDMFMLLSRCNQVAVRHFSIYQRCGCIFYGKDYR